MCQVSQATEDLTGGSGGHGKSEIPATVEVSSV